jgi:hypothetical protein
MIKYLLKIALACLMVTPLSAARIFVPLSNDFIIYDTVSRNVVKNIGYQSYGGVLWRPTADLQTFFFKNNFEDAAVIRLDESGKTETFTARDCFSDYQVVDGATLVIRRGDGLILWDIVGGSEQPLISVAGYRFFQYSRRNHAVVMQSPETGRLVVVSADDGSEKFAASDAFRPFSLHNNVLCYGVTDSAFKALNLANNNEVYHSLALGKNRLRGVWFLEDGVVLLQLLPGLTARSDFEGWYYQLYNYDTKIFTFLKGLEVEELFNKLNQVLPAYGLLAVGSEK